MQKFQSLIDKYFNLFVDYSVKLVLAIVIFIIGIWLIKILQKNLKKLFIRRDYDEALRGFLLSAIDLGLKIILGITVISQLGVATSSLVALLGAAGLAIGLALQGSLANFAGGIMIILMKPFKIGDWIEADGVSGTVKEITIFYTKLVTFHNLLAVIPNGKLSNDQIINYTQLGIRKDKIVFYVHYESDVKKALETLMKLTLEQKGVLKDPAPQVVVDEMTLNAIKLSIRFMASVDVFWDIHWAIMEQAKSRLEEADIKMPNSSLKLADGGK